jgi:hypothetical protein
MVVVAETPSGQADGDLSAEDDDRPAQVTVNISGRIGKFSGASGSGPGHP